MKDDKKTYHIRVRRAHTQMRGTDQYKGKENGVKNFLKLKKNPNDYDIEAWAWDGKEWHQSPNEFGDDFLKNPKVFKEFILDALGHRFKY